MKRLALRTNINIGVAALILIGGVLPLFHFWYFVGRIPAVTPIEARALLSEAGTNFALVDVRRAVEFEQGHLAAAVNWPLPEIKTLAAGASLPGFLDNRILLLYCDSGLDSARAAEKLRSGFDVDAFNVAGGLEAWIASVKDKQSPEFITGGGQGVPVPYRDSPASEQLALAAAVLIVKPLYMMLSALLIYFLLRAKTPEGVALRWGLIFFLAGEIFCAVNILFFNYSDYLLELLHSYGMAVGFAFVTLAAIEFLDNRVLYYSGNAAGCGLKGGCHPCVKEGIAECRVKMIMLLATAACLVLAFIPLTTGLLPISYNTSVYNLFHNYSHPVVFQIFETRYMPIYALAAFSASQLTTAIGRNLTGITKMLIAAGIGALGFSFLRLMVFRFYSDNLVWFEFWEETTELMFIGGVGLLMWIFRRRAGGRIDEV